MVKIAVLGCGKICHRFIKGLKLSNSGQLAGFGSRDKQKAKEYAEIYNVDFYGSYQDIWNNKDIDAVYISTINKTHFELVSKSLKAGKHVLCEKPMVETAEKYRELFSIAKQNNVLLMEAIKGVFLPMNIQIRELLKGKVIGDVLYCHGSYVYNGHISDNHWVMDKDTGGCLQDVGSYPGSVVSYVLDKKPLKVEKKIVYHKDIPAFAEVLVDYEDNIKAELNSSFISYGPNFLEIHGTEGYIKAENFWKGSSFELYRFNGEKLEKEIIETKDFKTDFYYEAEHFIECINQHKIQSDVISLDFLLDLLKLTDQNNY